MLQLYFNTEEFLQSVVLITTFCQACVINAINCAKLWTKIITSNPYIPLYGMSRYKTRGNIFQNVDFRRHISAGPMPLLDMNLLDKYLLMIFLYQYNIYRELSYACGLKH